MPYNFILYKSGVVRSANSKNSALEYHPPAPPQKNGPGKMC